MPIFEYYCPICDPTAKHTEEMLQIRTDEIITPLCECGRVKKKKISSGSFVLKGAGFYKNDYGPKQPKKKES
jgi:predicted nucleic acid-binding Zn ribbon protein